MANRYQEFTQLFNLGKKRAILASGQAVVMHNLAMMSKDGDWILKEDQESFEFVMQKLSEAGARYRFGAPLTLAWHRQGWSSHFELRSGQQRLRLDFFSRPPRLSQSDLDRLWLMAEDMPIPFVDKESLIKQKLTDRLKDYAIIGELARSVRDPEIMLKYSQSARDIIGLLEANPDWQTKISKVSKLSKLQELRPALVPIDFTAPDCELEVRLALERERYRYMQENLKRIEKYRQASEKWAVAWPLIERQITDMTLLKAHDIIVARAKELLPNSVE